jgi:hypothetical protein
MLRAGSGVGGLAAAGRRLVVARPRLFHASVAARNGMGDTAITEASPFFGKPAEDHAEIVSLRAFCNGFKPLIVAHSRDGIAGNAAPVLAGPVAAAPLPDRPLLTLSGREGGGGDAALPAAVAQWLQETRRSEGGEVDGVTALSLRELLADAAAELRAQYQEAAALLPPLTLKSGGADEGATEEGHRAAALRLLVGARMLETLHASIISAAQADAAAAAAGAVTDAGDDGGGEGGSATAVVAAAGGDVLVPLDVFELVVRLALARSLESRFALQAALVSGSFAPLMELVQAAADAGDDRAVAAAAAAIERGTGGEGRYALDEAGTTAVLRGAVAPMCAAFEEAYLGQVEGAARWSSWKRRRQLRKVFRRHDYEVKIPEKLRCIWSFGLKSGAPDVEEEEEGEEDENAKYRAIDFTPEPGTHMDLAQLRAAQLLEWPEFDNHWAVVGESYFKVRRDVYEQTRLNRKSTLYGIILLTITGIGDWATAIL